MAGTIQCTILETLYKERSMSHWPPYIQMNAYLVILAVIGQRQESERLVCIHPRELCRSDFEREPRAVDSQRSKASGAIFRGVKRTIFHPQKWVTFTFIQTDFMVAV